MAQEGVVNVGGDVKDKGESQSQRNLEENGEVDKAAAQYADGKAATDVDGQKIPSYGVPDNGPYREGQAVETGEKVGQTDQAPQDDNVEGIRPGEDTNSNNNTQHAHADVEMDADILNDRAHDDGPHREGEGQAVETGGKFGQADQPQDDSVEGTRNRHGEDVNDNSGAQPAHADIEMDGDGNVGANDASHTDVNMEPDHTKDDDPDKNGSSTDDDSSKDNDPGEDDSSIEDDKDNDKDEVNERSDGDGRKDVNKGKDRGGDNSLGNGIKTKNEGRKPSKRKLKDIDYTETTTRPKKPKSQKNAAGDRDITRTTGKIVENRRWMKLEEDIFVSPSILYLVITSLMFVCRSKS